MTVHLTPTQRFILAHARDKGHVFRMYRGDRNGTRLGGEDELGRPGFVAYSNPEYWLLSRKFIERYGNEHGYYRLTEAGLAAIGNKAPPPIKRTKCERFGWGASIRAAARTHHGKANR